MFFYKSAIEHSGFPYAINIHDTTIMGAFHDQDFYEFFITLSDSIVWHHGEQRDVLPSGSLVFVCPGEAHCLRPSYGCEFKYINLSFSTEEYLRVLDFLDMKMHRADIEAKDKIICLSAVQRDKWLGRLRQIGVREFDSDKQKLNYSRVLLSRIISEILYDEEMKDNVPSWLNDICMWLKKDTNFSSSLDEVCYQCGKTKEHLCRSMKKYLSVTPMEYINNLRLKYIASMLEISDVPISKLSLSAGFYSESYFEKLFKAKYKMTAGKYRKINRVHKNQY